MNNRIIFSFWEPRESVIPYLALCRNTWQKNLPDYSIVVLDYSNLDDYLDRDVYDLRLLRRLSLPTQKDAISVAVIKEHGGVFMDLDTLIFGDLDPILRKLEKTQLIMFGSHMAFLAARPNARVLTLWLERIREKLKCIEPENLAGVPWDYVGNQTLAMVLDEIVNYSKPSRWMTGRLARLGEFANWQSGWAPGLTRLLRRTCESLLRRRKEFFFHTVYRQYLTSLDRVKSSYILEAQGFKGQALGPEAQYLWYWFESNLDPQAVMTYHPIVVGLHNSWTPSWYKNLSADQVLEHPCLLSKTLRILNGNESTSVS